MRRFFSSFFRRGFPSGRGGGKPPDLLRTGEEDGFFAEQVKGFRAKFEYRIDALQQKVVAVTSAVAGEGKTMLCAHLAAGLASSGRKKVLLVDADLRKSDLARGLRLPLLPGLTEFLAGSAGPGDIVRNSVRPGLHVVPAGTAVTTGGELLSGERFRWFLAKAREQYDTVLLDTPPLLPVADTLSLKGLVDGFVLVYRTGFTPNGLFRQALDEAGEQNVLGVVLNAVEPRTQRYYQRYYGRYYRPGSAREPGAPSGS